jgi:hypothetical protein
LKLLPIGYERCCSDRLNPPHKADIPRRFLRCPLLTHLRHAPPFAYRDVMGYRRVRSFRLDVGRSDHLAPFLGFVGEELAELRRWELQCCCTRSASRALSLGSARPALISFGHEQTPVVLSAEQRSGAAPSHQRRQARCLLLHPQIENTSRRLAIRDVALGQRWIVS